MKSFVYKLFGSILLAGLVISCQSDKTAKGDYLPDLKIEVPAALKDNADAVTFIDQSSTALNHWSKSLEDLVVECQPYIGKKEAELSPVEKVKLGKLMMEFMSQMGKLAVKSAEMDQQYTQIEYGLTDDEQKALTAVMDAFNKRIDEINARYQDFGKADEESE